MESHEKKLHKTLKPFSSLLGPIWTIYPNAQEYLPGSFAIRDFFMEKSGKP